MVYGNRRTFIKGAAALGAASLGLSRSVRGAGMRNNFV